MERRREQRIQFNGPATLKLLANFASPEPVQAEILDLSGSGMRLRLLRPIPCGLPVEIDCGDTMALGEICHCAPESGACPDGPFIVGVRVSQVVASLEQLRRFSQRLDEFAQGNERERSRQ